MSQPTTSSQFAASAVEYLLKENIQRIHRRFSEKYIDRADVGHLTISVPVKEIGAPFSNTPTSLRSELERYGMEVAHAAFQIGRPTMMDFSKTHHTFDFETMPKLDEVITIRGQVEESVDCNPKLMFVITVNRARKNGFLVREKKNGVNKTVGIGFVILQANQPLPSAANPPVLASPGPSAPRLGPRTMKCWSPRLSCLSPNRPQKFMYANARAAGTQNYKQLERVLEGWGISPVAVTCCESFLGSRPNKIFFFDVSTATEEAKIRERMAKEEEWTETFRLENFSKNRPFFTETIQLGEMFQTVLVATSLHKPSVPNWDRQQMVWSEGEVRKALRDMKIVEMEKELNEEGKRLMALYKRELLGS
ncbi:hypothetical protein B9Z55_004096 [Caenorhabditis nigoni]|uniref:Uncharacterized protein n=1 Tax=Caenorhabditis nigoni TaxID=1611254 RepID=A0A2G5UUX4_9PELO|nr:hypothetical protein B9Z55_004096 [Caenorhabditis nigoni]